MRRISRRNKKKLPPVYEPKEGFMLAGRGEIRIKILECIFQQRMHPTHRSFLKVPHWSEDPSYNWNRKPWKKRKI